MITDAMTLKMNRKNCAQATRTLGACGLLAMLTTSITPPAAVASVASPVSLQEVITHALAHHPEMLAARLNEYAQEEKITVAASVYYPQLSAQAMVAQGLPGSTAATGVEGIVVSPFHRGPAAGLIVKQTLWDFGRTGDQIAVAQSHVVAAQADTQATEVPVLQNALESYYACARDRKITQLFQELATEAKVIEREVQRFVKSSQRSVVEQYLAESQVAELETIFFDAEKKQEIELKRLMLLTGLGASALVSCPEMGAALIKEFQASTLAEQAGAEEASEQSPYLRQASARLQLSLKEKDLAFDDHYPKLMGVAGYGYIADTWAGVPRSNYSLAVGIVIPLFEGFRVKAQVESAQANFLAKSNQLEGTKLNVHAANLALSKKRESSQLRINSLTQEVSLAVKSFQTAKKRYFSYQGSLVDLRESLRNLSRSQQQLQFAEFDYLMASSEKALINGGGRPKQK